MVLLFRVFWIPQSGAPVVGCAAENMVLLCELGNPFPSKQRVGFSSERTDAWCMQLHGVKCSLFSLLSSPLFSYSYQTQIQLIFETSEISLDTKQINTQLQLST